MTLLPGALLLTACAVGPDYHAPEVAAPEHFSEPALENPAELTAWWTQFNDIELNSLISRAMESNLDFKQAGDRVREARARRSIYSAEQFPVIHGTGSASRDRISENGLPFGPPVSPEANAQPSVISRSVGKADSSVNPVTGNSGTAAFNLLPEFSLYQLGFDASWELDIFGRLRRQVEAANADLAASVEDRHAMLLSVISEVARNYAELRGMQHQFDIAEKNLKSQRETLQLTRDQLQNGVATDLDVARADAEVETTAADLPMLHRGARQTLHRLAVLLGQTPETLYAELEAPAPIPVPPAEIAAGLPADLLRRRPDIRKSEQDLISATAQVGVATADLYPRFTITGDFTFASAETHTLFKGASRGFGVGPGFTVPLFDAGALRAIVRARTAEVDESLLKYRQTVLTAFQEVDDALVAYTTERERETSLESAVKSRQEALGYAQSLYKQGVTDFLTVLDAERFLFTSEDSLAKSQQTVTTDAIALYKALGGGWEIDQSKEG